MTRSRAATGRLLFVAFAATAAGCFALFPLDDYGPGDSNDAGLRDGGPVDSNIISPPPGDGAPLVDPNARRVFITSTRTDGFIGGLGAGDKMCQALATDAGLPGSYKAWLSTNAAGTAGGRFDVLAQEGGPPPNLYLVDTSGRLLAASWADLLAEGHPNVAIDRDENAQIVGVDYDGGPVQCSAGSFTAVWTNTDTDAGPATQNDCSAYTQNGSASVGRVGLVSNLPLVWTNACNLACNLKARLYCFEQ